MHILGRRGVPTIQLSVTSPQVNYNLFTAAGSPSFVCNVVLTINVAGNPGIQGSAQHAIRTAGFAVGSTFTLISNNIISAFAGVGGKGAANVSSGVNTAAVAGSPGGVAIDLHLPLTIDNTNGFVYGGAGGGGGAGGWLSSPDIIKGGGGGGGGRGYNNAAGGVAAHGTITDGGAGGSGSSSAAGVGGDTGGTDPGTVKGGNGGGWGAAGSAGNNYLFSNGAAGGAAGKAIALNGFSITWLGGNNTTQVKGAVS